MVTRFKDILGVEARSVKGIHRIGRKQRSKTRPVIVKFYDHREKIYVLKNSYKLKGKTISISEDFSAATRYKRKMLWKSTSNARRAGKKVKLVYVTTKLRSTANSSNGKMNRERWFPQADLKMQWHQTDESIKMTQTFFCA